MATKITDEDIVVLETEIASTPEGTLAAVLAADLPGAALALREDVAAAARAVHGLIARVQADAATIAAHEATIATLAAVAPRRQPRPQRQADGSQLRGP